MLMTTISPVGGKKGPLFGYDGVFHVPVCFLERAPQKVHLSTMMPVVLTVKDFPGCVGFKLYLAIFVTYNSTLVLLIFKILQVHYCNGIILSLQ